MSHFSQAVGQGLLVRQTEDDHSRSADRGMRGQEIALQDGISPETQLFK